MIGTDKFEDRSAITGIRASRMGRRLMVNLCLADDQACGPPSPTPV